jgi:hypothetical protein
VLRQPRDTRLQHPQSIRLTDRDYAVLQALYDYRYLTTVQLRHLFFPSMHRAYERLAQLYNHRLIERVFQGIYTDKMNKPLLYVLDRNGFEVLQVATATVLQWQRTHKPVGNLFLRHNIAMNDARIALTRACGQTGIPVLEWRAEHRLRQNYDRVTIPKHSQPIAVIPDGYCQLRIDERPIHLFFEMDMGTMSFKTLPEENPRLHRLSQ